MTGAGASERDAGAAAERDAGAAAACEAEATLGHAGAAAGRGAHATVRIRTADASDLDAIMAIERASFEASAWERETMRAELASDWGRYLVAEGDDGRALGYAGLRAVGDEGDVQTIAVQAAERGRGIGRALLAELLAEAGRRGVRELFLEVRADNPAARTLYESVGFREIGVRPRYYQPEDVDAVVMKREAQR